MLERALRALQSRRRVAPKIFCVGRNKTGTTSLERALADFGYPLGDQAAGEALIRAYRAGDWAPILAHCRTAVAFQDAPFSWPYTWLVLHEHFPDARFVLTVRDSDSWYRSLTTYHRKLFSAGGPLTRDHLEAAEYRYRGFMWEVYQGVWKTDPGRLHEREELIANYERHNADVMHYFRDKANLLVIDVAEEDAYERLARFLGEEPRYARFPRLNVG